MKLLRIEMGFADVYFFIADLMNTIDNYTLNHMGKNLWWMRRKRGWVYKMMSNFYFKSGCYSKNTLIMV